ncbi:hypothetical protein CC79DRAFT_1334127 [Sarocladium strictum]
MALGTFVWSMAVQWFFLFSPGYPLPEVSWSGAMSVVPLLRLLWSWHVEVPLATPPQAATLSFPHHHLSPSIPFTFKTSSTIVIASA